MVCIKPQDIFTSTIHLKPSINAHIIISQLRIGTKIKQTMWGATHAKTYLTHFFVCNKLKHAYCAVVLWARCLCFKDFMIHQLIFLAKTSVIYEITIRSILIDFQFRKYLLYIGTFWVFSNCIATTQSSPYLKISRYFNIWGNLYNKL